MSWMMAAVYDRFMRQSEEACLATWRAELLADLRGEVLEVGAGTGTNLPHYPAAVTRLVLAEPDRHMRMRLARRAPARVEVAEASLAKLPWPDGSFDAVVSTLVLCSVPDPAAALAEVHRVLRRGGALVFLEHVAAEGNPRRLLWQQRIEPIWTRVAGGCHLARRTADTLTAAGFRIERIERESIRKAMPLARPSIRGTARRQ